MPTGARSQTYDVLMSWTIRTACDCSGHGALRLRVADGCDVAVDDLTGGAGGRDLKEQPNVLRVLLGEAEAALPLARPVAVLETALAQLTCFALGAAGGFASLSTMSSVARLLGYLVCLAALPLLSRRFASLPGALRLPGGLAIPLAAACVCVWLIAQAEIDTLRDTGLLEGTSQTGRIGSAVAIGTAPGRRPGRPRRYGVGLTPVIAELWEISGRLCGKLLVALSAPMVEVRRTPK